MADFLESGVSWLADKFEDEISQPITYRQKAATTTISLNATPANLNSSFSQAFGGTQLELGLFDFVVKQESLGVVPAEGDIITYAGNYYRVGKPNADTQIFDDDEYGTTYTIHTKFFGPAT